MICSYCLRSVAVVSRRCQACQDYLDQLHSSDEEADRLYGAQLVMRAALNFTYRQRGGIGKAA